jgi:hypothetical protein
MSSYTSQLSVIIDKAHNIGIPDHHAAQAYALILVLFPKGLASRGAEFVQHHVERFVWELLCKVLVI